MVKNTSFLCLEQATTVPLGVCFKFFIFSLDSLFSFPFFLFNISAELLEGKLHYPTPLDPNTLERIICWFGIFQDKSSTTVFSKNFSSLQINLSKLVSRNHSL
jgi:hypothetical protein